jgi:hypothetical protein
LTSGYPLILDPSPAPSKIPAQSFGKSTGTGRPFHAHRANERIREPLQQLRGLGLHLPQDGNVGVFRVGVGEEACHFDGEKLFLAQQIKVGVTAWASVHDG